MHWPQLAMLALYFLALMSDAVKSRQERDPSHFLGTLTAICLNSVLLYFGGFWGQA